MKTPPLTLSPEDVAVLMRCPLHYHFRQQTASSPGQLSAQIELETLVRAAIQNLHAAGGPARMSLRRCLAPIQHHPDAQRLVEHYYQRLRQDWQQLMASNETMALKISIGGVPLTLQGTVDRLDKTRDGGILAILFRTGAQPLPPPESLRQNPALTIYHALVAATYPLKRPVRVQELWLPLNEAVTIELSEEEYRHNLSRLREPVKGLARSEVRARPGLHCDHCPYKYHGCPVYAHDDLPETGSADFDSASSGGKIPPRHWVFKI